MQQDQGDKEILLYTVCKMVVIGGGVCERIIKWDLFSRVNNLRVSEKLYNCSNPKSRLGLLVNFRF